MNAIWKYTIGILVEVVIKVLQKVISPTDNIIKGTGSNDTASSNKEGNHVRKQGSTLSALLLMLSYGCSLWWL